MGIGQSRIKSITAILNTETKVIKMIRALVGVDQGRVVVAFSMKTSILAMSATEARDLADRLTKNAAILEQQQKEKAWPQGKSNG